MMKFQILIIACSWLVFSRCNSNNVLNEPNLFKVPSIINTNVSDALKEQANDSLPISRILIMGTFTFADTLDLANLPQNPKEDSLSEKYLNSTDNWIEYDSYVNGFEMFLDYSQTIYYGEDDSPLLKYYPVFFVNSTSSTKVFTGLNGTAVGVQQANFGGQKWLPITKKIKPFLMCGNNFMYLEVNPGEFVLLLVRKFSGDYRPKVRVAIKNGQSIYVSRTFIGNINESQYKYLDSLSTVEYDEDVEIFQF